MSEYIKTVNIAVVNQHREDIIGGSELQCDLIATELTYRKYNITYIAVGGQRKKYTYPYKIINTLNDGRSIIKALQEIRPEIIYWRFNKHHFRQVSKWAYKNSIPFIFAVSHIRDLNPLIFNKNVGKRKAMKIYLKSLWNHLGFKYVTGLTVNNESHLSMSNIEPKTYIPNGALTASEEFYWPNPYCAWVSSVKQTKRPEMLIKLADKFNNKGIDFIMVGKIQEKEYNWINEPRNLPENVHYLGVKTPEKVNGIFRGALLHIHTCYPEGFPNVFIQAWMQGTPSISLGYDPSGYITDNKLGEFTNNDFNSFVGIVRTFLENNLLRKNYGENARIFAESMFNINNNVDILETFMKTIMKNSKF